MEALERLELVVYTSGERTDGNVTNIAEEVLDADFFGFFGFDYGGCVDEGFCRGCAILYYPNQPQLHHPRSIHQSRIETQLKINKIKVEDSKHTSLISSTAK